MGGGGLGRLFYVERGLGRLFYVERGLGRLLGLGFRV